MAQDDFSLLLSAFPKAESGGQSEASPAAAPSAKGGDNVSNFVGTYLPLAQRVAEQTGVAPEALLGQWGLETGWGKSVIPGTNNLGNIKDFSGKGPKAVDNLTKTTDAYRQYETVDDFGDDFAGLLSRRYRTALNTGGNTQKYFSELKRLGYAEAPNYVDAGVKATKMVSRVIGSPTASSGSFSNVRDMATDRSMGEAITDNLAGAASGVVQGAKMIADVFGANNAVSETLDGAGKSLTDTQSQYRKDQRTERNIAIKSAEGSGSTWEEIKANVGGFAEAPLETTLNALGTSAPTILMSFIPGLGQAQAARLIMQGAMGAAQGAGGAKGSIYEAVYQQLKASGVSHDDAAKAAAGAQAYDGQNGGAIAANAILGTVAGTSGVEAVAGRIAGKQAGDVASRGIAGRAGMGVLKETPVEMLQGGGEKVTTNVALQNEGYDVPTFQGAAGQAVGEGLASAPGGAAFGAMDRGAPTPPPAPNPLQAVVDQAQKPGSVLSRAVVSTGVVDQPAAPPTAPGSMADPISARVSVVEADLRSNSTLEKIRGLTPDASSEFLYALNIAKNPGTRADVREQAITQVEQVLETAKSGTAFTMVPPEKTEPSNALAVPGQQGGELAAQQGGPLAPNGMGEFFDPNTVDVDAVRVDNMIGGPRAIEGPRAQIGTNVSTEPQNIDTSGQPVAAGDTSTQPAPETIAPTDAGIVTPADQQTVAPATSAAPATPVVKPGAGGTYAGDPSLPAATRKRAGMLRQLADQGYETVERRGNEFFLKNSKTGQELKLDGMADSQLARKAIADSIRAAADQSPNSPRNDLAESTAAQNEAGNYPKPPVNLNGFTIRIENPQGSKRRGVDKDGVAWESEMKSDYGYIEGTKAKDGDGVDVLIGNRSDSGKIFVIDQVNEDGSFDEPKVVMGVTGEDQARSTYLSNYEKGWTGLGAITEMTREQFNDWLKSGGAMKPTALGKKSAASKPAAAAPSEKARWIKAILDNSRLAGETGIQLDVTPDGKLNFLGDPNSSKQGQSLLATLAEAKKAGATNEEIANAIRASKRSKAEIPAPQGQYATLEEAKAYLSQQRRSNGSVSGLPIQMADGTFGIAIKGSREYAEAERQREGASNAGSPQGEIFTIPDGGKKRKLKKVSKASLPKKSSPQRPGDPRPISQDEAAAIEQMAAILGKTVVFYEVADSEGRLADGFVNPGEPNVIYVATETTVNPVAIFGHEFAHTLRETNPEAWNAIAAVVRKRVKDAKGFRKDYYGDEAAEQRGDAELGMEQGGELEELVSDLGGNLMMDAGFWRDVFAQIQKDHGKNAKGIIARLAAAIEQMVARVMAAINQNGFNANDYVDDLEAIRAEFAKALAGHIQKAGVSKSAMDAEIKKSVIRVSAEQKALQEFAEVDAQYRGTEQWMKAPNGQPSQLNERQWIQVRTPSFKAWFGDWEAFAAKQGGVWNDDKGEVSKVVDDNGEPLVVYHGTSKGGFSEFKAPGGKVRGDLGIFTTPNLEMAKTYNKRGSTKEIKFSDMDRDAIEGGDTPGYYASFVNIRNPYETDFEGAMWSGERPEQWVVVNEDGETQYTPTGNQFFDSEKEAQKFADSVGGEVEAAPDHWETTDDAVREARSNKNDGAIIRSVIDDGGGYSSYFNDPSDVFVALDPNQLKSATQNTGEFGKRTDDMRFSRDRDAVSDVDPGGYNEFTATPEDIALADAYEAKHGIRPYVTAGQLQVPIKLGQIRKSVKREHSKKNLDAGYIYHPLFGVPLNKNGTITLYFPTTNEDARRVALERTLKAPPGSNRVYLTNESGADLIARKPGNISILGDDIQANVLIQVDPSLLQVDTEHADGRIDFFIPIAEGDAFRGKMSQVKLFNMFAERAEPITRDMTLKDIERGIEDAMKRIGQMPEGERKKLVAKAKAVLKQEHNVGTLLSENGKLQKTRAGEYDLKHYEGDSVASLGLGLASAQQITEKLSSCPQHANCESLCLGDTSGQNLLYGGEGPFRAGPRLSQYLKTEAMVLHPEEFALVLHHEIKLLENWARKETGFETTKDEETGETVRTPKQLYQPSIRLNVTSDFRPVTWAPVIKAMPGVEFYDYTKLDTKPISKNHHLTYSSDGVAQVVDGVAVGNGNYNWDRMLRQLRNGFNVAMAFSDKNDMPKFVVDGSTGERFQVWNGDNYDARFLDPKPGQEGNLLNKGMIIGLTNKDRTKSGLAIMLEKQGPASATKAEWKKLINDIASDDRFINDKSVPYVLKWVASQKGEIDRKALADFSDSPAVKHNGFFIDYNPKRDGDTVVVADQERTKEAYKAQQPKVFEVARFSRDRKPDAYNQRIAALKDLISCLKK